MKLLHLAIQGFRSFRNDEVLTFPLTNGFYLLSGRNELEPTLGANGAGKSSVWEALTWVLFGRTTRGLKAKAISNWDDNYLCSVSLEYEDHGVRCVIARTWNPNSLTFKYGDAEPETIVQEDLERKLGIEFNAWIYAALMGQFSSFFFDLSSAEKLTLFSDVLNLQVWLKASDKAKLKVKELGEAIHALEVRRASTSSRLETLQSQLPGLRSKSNEWEAYQAADITNLKKEIAAVTERREKLEKELKVADAAVNELESRLTAAKRTLINRDDVNRKLERQEWEASKGLENAVAEGRKATSSAERVTKIRGDCPTCLQPLNPKHVERIATEYAAQRVELRRIEVECADTLTKVREKLELHKEATKTADRTVTALEHQLSSARSKQATARGALSGAKGEAQRTQKRLDEESERENPFVVQIAECRDGIVKAEKQLAAIQGELSETALRADRYQYWVTGFKELRLWVIEQALTELELLVNNSLVALGLEGWKVTFDVERENTSGGVTRGFSVFITGPENEEPAPWEAWSGGETQRLRVAGAVGLATLIASRRKLPFDFEVWDEPTAHLSHEGIQDLLDFFAERSKVEAKQIWLVDHHSLNAGGFDDEYVVVKDKMGSHIVQEGVEWQRAKYISRKSTTSSNSKVDSPNGRLSSPRASSKSSKVAEL